MGRRAVVSTQSKRINGRIIGPADGVVLGRTEVDSELVSEGNRQPDLKIIGFDSWTGGAFNWERLLPAFASRGMTFMVVHIGSWGVDPGRPAEEKVGPLLMRDVNYYQGKSLDEILDVERPDAVLF